MKDVFTIWTFLLIVMGIKALVDFADASGRGPFIDWSREEGRLVLPRSMQAALDRSNAPFGRSLYRMKDFPGDVIVDAQREKRAPFAVVDDFDLDGRRDVALLEHSPWGTRIAVLMAGKDHPRVVVLEDTFGPNRWNHLEKLQLVPVGRGPLRFHPAAESDSVATLFIAAPAFRVQRDATRSDVYRWQDGHFVGVPMYD